MQPIFPRKNLAINTLIGFRRGGTIFKFTDYFGKPEDEKNGWEKEHLEWKINHLHGLIDSLKEELNQTIHTSNALTVTTFFEELKANIEDWNLDTVNENDFLEISKNWNKESYSVFLDKIEKKETEYFNKPERTKYRHLEKYENTYFSPFTMRSETSVIENKNFFCVEDKPELIDSEKLPKYLTILNDITNKFNNSIAQELKLYNEGKLTAQIESEKSTYDKLVERFKNNKIIAGILIGFLIYGGLSQLIQLTKDNKENLFGKDGLIKTDTIQDQNKVEKANKTIIADSTKIENKIIQIDSITE